MEFDFGSDSARDLTERERTEYTQTPYRWILLWGKGRERETGR